MVEQKKEAVKKARKIDWSAVLGAALFVARLGAYVFLLHKVYLEAGRWTAGTLCFVLLICEVNQAYVSVAGARISRLIDVYEIMRNSLSRLRLSHVMLLKILKEATDDSRGNNP